MSKNGTLHRHFSKAKMFIERKDNDKARDYCDMGIAFVREKRSAGYDAKDKIEGVRVELWLERFWMFLENKNLLLG